jgi:OPA family sugar phosphate sensor protein UhpC-like MFS transporter
MLFSKSASPVEIGAPLPEQIRPTASLLAPTALKAFLAATIGYSLFYVCRLSLSVVKGPLIGEGLFTEFQVGVIGSALLYSYAFGKLVNGFLADRLNVRKFASWGLAISAAINLLVGFHAGFYLFFVLWMVNGWVQSIGAPCCIIGMTRWFSEKERGTYYGFWSASHNIGEGMTGFPPLSVFSEFSFFGSSSGKTRAMPLPPPT